MLLVGGIPAGVCFLDAILDVRLLGDGRRFVSPGDNGRHVEGWRYPAFSVVVSNLGAKPGGDGRIIEPDLLFDDASVPDGVKIKAAWPVNGDEVSAAVIVERDVERLVNVAHPMTKALEETELVAHVETEGKIARVVQNGGDDATIGKRARMANIDALCRARKVDIMLGRPLTRKNVGPRTSVGERAKLGINRNQSIDTVFDFRFQLFISER